MRNGTSTLVEVAIAFVASGDRSTGGGVGAGGRGLSSCDESVMGPHVSQLRD